MGHSDVVYVEERRGLRELIPGEPKWPIDVLWIPPLPSPPWKTDQWVKPAKWNPSDDYERVDRTQEDLMIECQKWQTDPADIYTFLFVILILKYNKKNTCST